MKPPALFKHQKQSIAFCKKVPTVFDMSDAGCVSADTEYLTPTGWKRIDEYKSGLVAQFYPTTREIEFVEPLEYIKRPCNSMIAIAPSRGTSQRLSHEHRVLYYLPDGSHHVMSAKEYMDANHQHNPSHVKAKFCTTFSVRSATALAETDMQIRLMVAVIADGYFRPFAHKPSPCCIRLKKQRKILRLVELLTSCGIKFDMHPCLPDGFMIFKFYAPRREKEFTDYWWGASQDQLEVIADELCYWDSSEDKRDNAATNFSTLVAASADFAQYAFSAAKRRSSLACYARDRSAQGRGVSVEYAVHAKNDDALVGPGLKSNIYEVANPEGFKYCFEVPTSFLLLRHNGYIFATGNTGKTRVGIEAFAARRKAGGGCLLVLCPKSLTYSAWKKDFIEYAPTMRCIVAEAKNRTEAFEADVDVYITNHDAVNWLAKQKSAFFKKFECLEIDEVTAFKTPTSQRSKAMVKVRKNFARVRLSSATPNSNGICNLWHQMFILDGGKRLGTSYFGFRSSCCKPTMHGAFTKWEDKPGIESIVGALIKDVVIRHKFEDCVDIPANHKYAVTYKLNKQHMAHYKQMEEDQILGMGTKIVTAVNAASVYSKLLQIASGAVYSSDDYALVDSGRTELVIDLVEARAHSVVFFQWKHQRDELISEAKRRKISFATYDGDVNDANREAAVDAFQRGELQVLFAHPQSAGHGLTLTRGTATIWASPTHNLEHFAQGWKRVHRIGQKEKTETIVVVAEDTIDERVWEVLQRKEVNMTDLLQELKELQNGR